MNERESERERERETWEERRMKRQHINMSRKGEVNG